MKHPNPPKWPLWILKKVCSDHQLEILYGDAIEMFHKRVQSVGARKAKLLFLRDTISSIRHFSLKKRKYLNVSSTASLYKNYFQLIRRSFLRNKLSTSINFIGLVVGFFAALMIAQYAQYELSYDQFHQDHNKTFRVSYKRTENNQVTFHGATTFLSVGPIMQDKYAEVYNQCRFYYPFAHGVINYKEEAYHEEKPVFVDDSYFQIFSFPLIKGDERTALTEPNTVVLSEDLASKYFGIIDPIGKTIRFSFEDGETDLKVTGVLKNPRYDSHLQLDMLISMKTIDQWDAFADGEWSLPFYHTYIQLQKGTDIQSFEEKSSSILTDFRSQNNSEGDEEIFIIQPLKDIYLDSHLTFELGENGNRQAINFLILIAALILIIVYLNYINLTTALSSLKGKEVGIRKVMGSHKLQIVPRFLLESFTVNITSLLVAIGLTIISINYFVQSLGIYFEISMDPSFWLAAFIIAILGSIISAFYPAFVSASYEPIAILRGKLSSNAGGGTLRKVLISAQFAISVAMIGGMILIARQTSFVLSKDLGFDSDKLLVISAPRISVEDGAYLRAVKSFRNEIVAHSSVNAFTTSSSVPGRVMSAGQISRLEDPEAEPTSLHFNSVDYDYFKSYKLSFLAGRPFSRTFQTDIGAVIINEIAMQSLGYQHAEEAIGTRIGTGNFSFEVIGVVKNYHHSSLKNTFESIVFSLNPNRTLYFSLNINTDQLVETLEGIEAKMKEHFPNHPFEYFFLDRVFDQEFKAEMRYGSLLKGFSALSVLLSSLGLFGLSSFLITQKAKEIGIRKVLGATKKDLFDLLSSFFLLPMVSGSLLACVILYFIGNSWLRTFAFRIEMEWLVFAIPLIIVFVMTAITLGIQTSKAGNIQPAETLKNE